MNKIKEISQPLLGRTRVVYEHTIETVTPARKEIQKTIASLHKAKPDVVTINKITSLYGTGTVVITADIYTSVDGYKKTVPTHLVKKSKIEEPQASA